MSKQLLKQNNERFVVDFWITGKCDMECPFCYGADVPIRINNKVTGHKELVYKTLNETNNTKNTQHRPEMNFEQIQNVILKLKGVGVTTLTFSGGEPFLRKDVSEIIEFAHGQSMEIYLSTNGTYLLPKYNNVKKYLSALGLPLDGSTAQMNTKMGRRKYHFKNIRNILKFFHSHHPNHIVKIGTIVSKINLQDIEAIAELLFGTSPTVFSPDVWRLYQFEALKDGATVSNAYSISDEEFLSICKLIKEKYPSAKISQRSRHDHSNSYFFVTPDGMLQTVTDKHRDIADLLSIEENELKKYINQQHSHVINRASQNRNWLKDIPKSS